MAENDKYVHGMDWADGDNSLSYLSNYRNYQYELVGKYVGKNILEVGTGDRGFTNEIVKANNSIERIISIEPSKTLFELHKSSFKLPKYVDVKCLDLFNIEKKDFGLFDTAIFIHVLEHIERDRAALDHTYELLSDQGMILIEVPALPSLFSVHDQMLGHYRRYTKKMMKRIIDPKKFKIVKMWYQDPIGVLGSFYYFKLRKIKLTSDKGQNLISSQGGVYDKYIIPFEKKLEKYITFPFGLSLTVVLKKL